MCHVKDENAWAEDIVNANISQPEEVMARWVMNLDSSGGLSG